MTSSIDMKTIIGSACPQFDIKTLHSDIIGYRIQLDKWLSIDITMHIDLNKQTGSLTSAFQYCNVLFYENNTQHLVSYDISDLRPQALIMQLAAAMSGYDLKLSNIGYYSDTLHSMIGVITEATNKAIQDKFILEDTSDITVMDHEHIIPITKLYSVRYNERTLHYVKYMARKQRHMNVFDDKLHKVIKSKSFQYVIDEYSKAIAMFTER